MTKKPSEVFDIPSPIWKDAVEGDWREEFDKLVSDIHVRKHKEDLSNDRLRVKNFITTLIEDTKKEEREKCQAEKDIASGL